MLFVLCFLNLSFSLHFYSPLIQLTCIDSPIRIPESAKFCLCNPESGKILLVESEILVFGIQNTA